MRWRRRTAPRLSPLAEALSVPEPRAGWQRLDAAGDGGAPTPSRPSPVARPLAPPAGMGSGSGLLGLHTDERTIDLDASTRAGRTLRTTDDRRRAEGTLVEEAVVVVRRESTPMPDGDGTGRALAALGRRVELMLNGLERVDRHLDAVDRELESVRAEVVRRPDRVEVLDLDQHCRRLDADISRLRVELRSELERGLVRLGGELVGPRRHPRSA